MPPKSNSLIRKFLFLYLKLASRARYVFAVDLFCLVFAVYMGYALRFTFLVESENIRGLVEIMLEFSLCILAFLYIGKTYKIIWPRASVEEYSIFLRWYVFGAVFFIFILHFFISVPVPRSSLSILIILGIVFPTAARALWKLAFITRTNSICSCKNTLIIGAGQAGTLIARDILRNPCELCPVGFVDDNPYLSGMSLASLKILGTSKNIREIVIEKQVEVVLITVPSATGVQIKKFVQALEGLNVKVRILPGLIDLADGHVSISRLRAVRLEDLLRREPIKLDNPDIDKLIKGKTILVTGAGGSIGSEICTQVLTKEPAQLLALGHGEQSIYQLMESFSEAGVKIPIRPIIADIADPIAIAAVFEQYKPQVVFHAAAHKHVPLMEENPREALRVNSFGTRNLAVLAGQNGAERMVMISTDKAVHPTSVMGATKRIAERLLLGVQNEYPNTMYMAVRFGNVLGSRGSVVPKFEKQIEKGGPLTVTHKDMKRYFMLIPEAVSLVLEAGAMGNGGELFVLDMGELVNITEMAETLIRLHGYEPYKDIQIDFSGIRPGEKLYEELFYDPINVNKTDHTKMFLSKLTPEEGSIFPETQLLLKESAFGQITTEGLKKNIFRLAQQLHSDS